MLRQGAQHALLLCAEACWLAPNTMPWMHCSTPCWLVQYCQCADWRAGCASPRVARVAREARLSFNPAAHVRRGSCSTGCGHRCGRKRPPSALLSPAFYDNFRFIIAAELYLAVFFIGVSQLRILVLSSSSCAGAVRILVSLASVVSTSSE